MEDVKKKVEAILFTTGRFMSVEEVAAMAGIGSSGFVAKTLDELRKDYEIKNSALVVINENSKWKLNIRKEYLHLTLRLLADCEMERPFQETLAVIAYKNPVLQSDIIKIRGNGGYEHVKFLRENGFISSERYGRTRLLKLTSKFFDYFDIVEDQLKSKFDSLGIKFSDVDIRKGDKSEDGKIPDKT